MESVVSGDVRLVELVRVQRVRAPKEKRGAGV
jgi:hypothetical protein